MANKGLGRGYASLMGLNDVEELTANNDSDKLKVNGSEVLINLNDIDPNYEQPRKNFDEEALSELAESIKLHGVIQPIVVTPIGKRFMIIAGERRFRASKLAGKTEIPAIIKHYTPQQIKEISLIENLQREDLNPIEAGRAIKTLMTEFNMTQETAADRIGKSRSAIANTLRLLTLDEGVIDLIEKGRLSAGHARTLVVVPTAHQFKLALKACDNQMNVREMEKMVREFLNPKPTKEKPKQEQSLELAELVANMQRTFATKITAVGNGNKGRIYIDYFTKDDLDRICSLVSDWMKTSFKKEEY
ncbi:MAG: ParB/RepB/Spo0J family partition protein [Corallococcus sp.]|nr:ParB/RepB/Spo0J family partition protein [Corallococcus sp.]